MYVKNLEASIEDAELTAMAAEFGDVTSAVVSRDGEGTSKGFGFVNFKEAGAASACVEALHGKDIKGKALWAGRAQKKGEREAVLRQK